MSFFRIVFGLLLLSLPVNTAKDLVCTVIQQDGYVFQVEKKTTLQTNYCKEALFELQEDEQSAGEKEKKDTRKFLDFGSLLSDYLVFSVRFYANEIVTALRSVRIPTLSVHKYILFHCLIIPF